MPAVMECPSCHGLETKVTDTRSGLPLGRTIRRRRECLACRCRWTTYEFSDRWVAAVKKQLAKTQAA